MLKNKLLVAALASAFAMPAMAGDFTPSSNVSLVNDYLYRGISQTGGDPAIQGGLDYTHSSGFYLGTWGSNVGWLEDFQGYDKGNMEIDLYGGFRGPIGKSDFTFDVGAIQYYYPGDKPAGVPDADTTEIYGALTYKWLSAKYSHSTGSLFGWTQPDGDKTKGSGYLELNGAYYAKGRNRGHAQSDQSASFNMIQPYRTGPNRGIYPTITIEP